MRIVIIGGTGLIGSQVIEKLKVHGHEAVAAAPQLGVNTITGEGLAEILSGADTVVDVSNSPSFADADVLEFFTTSTTNLTAAARAAGVGHYLALSIVGCDRLPDSGYMRAKVAQEELITRSGLPYTIVRATQFFEFLPAIAATATTPEGTVLLPPAPFQPMASADVATAVGRAAAGAPAEGGREIGGPERGRMDEFVATALARAQDPRRVVSDPHARYFGTELTDDSLVPGPDADLGPTTYEHWAGAQQPLTTV